MQNKDKFECLNIGDLDRFKEGFALFGQDWAYLYANEAMAKFLQKKREEVIGKSLLELYPDVEKTELFAAMKRCMEERMPQYLETDFSAGRDSSARYEISIEPVEQGIFMTSIDITNRKKLEEELKQKNIELLDAERMARVGNWMALGTDPPHAKVSWSKELSRISHRDEENFVPSLEAQLDLFVPEDARKLAMAAEHSSKTGEPYDLVLRFKDEPGRTAKWVLSHGEVLRDEKGQIVGMHGTAQDITERKNLEDELREKEKELNEAQRLGRIGNWSAMGLDPSHAKIFWSEELFRLVNRDLSLPSPTFEEQAALFVPRDTEKFAQAIQKTLATGEGYELELELKEEPGRQVRWILARGEIILDENGKPAGMRGTALDITERKKTDKKLSETMRALKAVSISNQILIHATDEAKILQEICQALVDVGYRFAWVGYKEDDEAKSVRPIAKAGYEEGYLETANITWADVDRGRDPVGKTIRSGEYHVVKDIPTDPDYIPWRDEAIKRGYYSSIGLPIIVNGIIGVLSIYSSDRDAFNEEEIKMLMEFSSDLSFGIKTLRSEQEKKKGESRIKELSELRSKFLTIMSHQLRTPLTVFRWNLELLLEGGMGEVKEAQKEYMRVLYSANEQLITRVDDLLAAINIEEGTVLVKLEDVAIDSIAAVIAKETEKKCELKKIKFTYNGPRAVLAPVMGDAEKLRHIFHVLMENAYSYTSEGGSITAKLERTDGMVRFEVSDTGIGIPEVEQHRIFERFYRASNAAVMLTDAFGVGLHASKYFIEKHGGKIGFQSKENVGSTFWFEIPVAGAPKKT